MLVGVAILRRRERIVRTLEKEGEPGAWVAWFIWAGFRWTEKTEDHERRLRAVTMTGVFLCASGAVFLGAGTLLLINPET